MTKFSIAIASHRLDQRLRNTISMVRNCIDYPREDYEICLSVNGDDKHTLEELEFHSKLVDRFNFAVGVTGPSMAKNASIALATNPWVVLLDSDDFLVPSALKIYDAAVKSSPKMQAAFEYSAINLLKNPPACSFPPTIDDFDGYFQDQINRIPVSAACGHATLIKKDSEFRFDPNFSFVEERKLAADMWAKETPVHILYSATYVYNWNENGISYSVLEGISPKQRNAMDVISGEIRKYKTEAQVVLELPYLSKKDVEFIQRAYELERLSGRN